MGAIAIREAVEAGQLHQVLAGIADAIEGEADVQRRERQRMAARPAVVDDVRAAADVFQTVFERLHARLPQLLQPERLQAWIGTTARREAIRRQRNFIHGRAALPR